LSHEKQHVEETSCLYPDEERWCDLKLRLGDDAIFYEVNAVTRVFVGEEEIEEKTLKCLTYRSQCFVVTTEEKILQRMRVEFLFCFVCLFACYFV
jgi:hypothetical protein